MILLTIFGALALSVTDTGAAAQAASGSPEKGHWIWVSDPTFGPRGGPPNVRRRVLVKDGKPAKLNTTDASKHPKVWRYVTETKLGPRSGAPTLRKVLVDQ